MLKRTLPVQADKSSYIVFITSSEVAWLVMHFSSESDKYIITAFVVNTVSQQALEQAAAQSSSAVRAQVQLHAALAVAWRTRQFKVDVARTS